MSRRGKQWKTANSDGNQEAFAVVRRPARRGNAILVFILLMLLFLLYLFLSDDRSTQPDTFTLVSPAGTEAANKPAKFAATPAGSVSLHQLITDSDVERLRQQLVATDKEAINLVVGGMTPIMLAASLGNVEIIDLLFTQGADPNKRGSMQRTALQYATEKNHGEAARRLLAYGADIDAYDSGRLTPLVMAANRGHTALALFYIEKGANLDMQHVEGWTALIDAAVRGDTKLVKALLAAGADRTLATKNGMKAVDYARQHGHKDIVALLVDQS